VAGPTLLTALATWIGFDARRGGEWALVGPLAVGMGAGAALSAFALARWGVLAERLRPARGDVAFAALLAAVLYGLAKVGQLTLAPQGSQQELWLTRLYLLLGDPRASGRMALGLTVLAVGAAEELTWRGLTFEALFARLGPGRAIALSSLAYAAAQAPSALRLADPLAGPNPLLVAEALVLGALLAAVRVRTGRLFPAVLAHALFSWAAFEFPLWRL
jgi:membrane protease YdiL (CAAX protease family)